MSSKVMQRGVNDRPVLLLRFCVVSSVVDVFSSSSLVIKAVEGDCPNAREIKSLMLNMSTSV